MQKQRDFYHTSFCVKLFFNTFKDVFIAEIMDKGHGIKRKGIFVPFDVNALQFDRNGNPICTMVAKPKRYSINVGKKRNPIRVSHILTMYHPENNLEACEKYKIATGMDLLKNKTYIGRIEDPLEYRYDENKVQVEHFDQAAYDKTLAGYKRDKNTKRVAARVFHPDEQH